MGTPSSPELPARRSAATGSAQAADTHDSAADARLARQQAIDALGPWFHNLHLPDGLQTAPHHFLGDFPTFKWRELEHCVPQSLTGWHVLDVGCNGGFYSFELARRGATVLGIDVDADYLRQARWAAQDLGLQDKIEFREMEVYEIARSQEQYDLVWFMGVFYHLRYPLLALDLLAQRTRRLLMFQTLTMPGDSVYPTRDYPIMERDALLEPGWPKMAFIEDCFAGDPTNWWIANHAGVEAMLRSSGLTIVERPGHEMYLCAPDPDTARKSRFYASQLAAVGRLIARGDGN